MSRLHLGGLVAAIGLGLWAIGACTQGGLQNPDGEPSFKLVAGGSDAGFTSLVEYTELDDETKFEVAITGGTPGGTIDVLINGQLVVTITLDAAGAANVEFSSLDDDSGDLPLPENFPRPNAGDAVVVGTLESAFEVDSSDDDNDNGDDDNDNGDDDDNDNGDDDDNANDNDDDDNANDNGDDDDDDNANDNGDDDNTNDNGDDNANDNDDDDNVNDNGDDNANDNDDDNANANDNDDDDDNDNSDDDDNENSNDNTDD